MLKTIITAAFKNTINIWAKYGPILKMNVFHESFVIVTKPEIIEVSCGNFTSRQNY